MARLRCVVSDGHLFDVRADIEAFDVVCVVEVVAEIVFREIERYFEARVVWGQAGRAQHCDCELGSIVILASSLECLA